MITYKAIIFDLGKVVFDLSFDRVFQFWANASSRPYDAIKDKFRFDDVFDKFEKDEITPKEFRVEISKRLDLTLTDQAFDEGWCALYLDTYRGIDNLLANLQERYQLVALTNTNSIHSNVWKNKIRPHFTLLPKGVQFPRTKSKKARRESVPNRS
jgi:putative hydrolase of the HAD superfamily